MSKSNNKILDKKLNEFSSLIQKERDLCESGSEMKRHYRRLSKELDKLDFLLKENNER